MKIWIDGDNCASAALIEALKLSEAHKVMVEVVADRPLDIPKSPWILFHQVPHGSGMTDQIIIEGGCLGDAVVTRDLQLSQKLLLAGLRVLNDRGVIWDQKKLKMRMEDSMLSLAMRAGGMLDPMPADYDDKDVKCFVSSMERLLKSS